MALNCYLLSGPQFQYFCTLCTLLHMFDSLKRGTHRVTWLISSIKFYSVESPTGSPPAVSVWIKYCSLYQRVVWTTAQLILFIHSCNKSFLNINCVPKDRFSYRKSTWLGVIQTSVWIPAFLVTNYRNFGQTSPLHSVSWFPHLSNGCGTLQLVLRFKWSKKKDLAYSYLLLGVVRQIVMVNSIEAMVRVW